MTVLLKNVVYQDDAAVRKAVVSFTVFSQAEIQLHVLFADVNSTTVTGGKVDFLRLTCRRSIPNNLNVKELCFKR